MTEATTKPRRFWLFLPFAILVVLAVAWTGFWFFAANKAEAIMTRWIEQEEGFGRIHRCASRTVGGFPFRFEVRCSEPSTELVALDPPRTVRAKSLVALAQVYEPGLIVAEITGPVSISVSGRPPSGQADWRLAQTSLRAVGRRPERLSVALDDVKLQLLEEGSAETVANADHLELHLRRNPESGDDKADIDFALQAAGAVIQRGPLGARPIAFEANGIARAVPDLRRKTTPQRLREWQAAGGRLELQKARLQQGEAIALASGDLRLSETGRPDGTLNVTMTGFDRLVREMVGGASGGGLQLGLVAGLAFLGSPAQLEGRRAVTVPFRFKDGAMSLGPIPLGKVEPLY
jgi:hypothetical protein